MRLSTLTAVAALVLAAAGSADAADTIAMIAESGKVTLAYRESSIPFSYVEVPGKPIGFAVEIANAVAAEIKKRLSMPQLEVTWMPVTSQNRIPLVNNGTVDLECGSTFNTTTRQKEAAFAVSHFFSGTRLLVKKSSGIKDYPDLQGKKVTITTGTANVQTMRKYAIDKKIDMEVIGAKDHADALLLVEADRASAFAMDDILLYGLKANAKDPDSLAVVGETVQVEPYACMLRKDDPKFKAMVDGVIVGMMKSGEFERLYNKWFMGPIPPRNQTIGMPMSDALKENIKSPSDRAAM
jgi:glutamate/aspartate transport system substrate-binding protein